MSDFIEHFDIFENVSCEDTSSFGLLDPDLFGKFFNFGGRIFFFLKMTSKRSLDHSKELQLLCLTQRMML